MRGFFRALWRDRRGVSALEFALVAPFLVLLAAGTIEFGRMMLLTQKLQNASFLFADLAARDKTLSEGKLDDIFLALGNLMQPFDLADHGAAVITSVTAEAGGDALVNWQRIGAGELDIESDVGEDGGEAILPDDLEMAAGETLIVTEVYYAFAPIFGLTTSPDVLRRVTYYKPRLGSLSTLLPGD
ncbi:MAG: TadE/TadG family type IV pilus assembly protein [Amaricoccus sp.]|uniref:TadE/TadG family type IV pilus assembly protein n=1 Tax=Amaricoccus sp. TaxID=1872485 RepID=UPI0033149864